MALLQVGQAIRGTYTVERYLGEGAFAEVYRVQHRFLGKQAMKIFKTLGMTVEETEEKLEEAILLSRIRHPNIVQVFDANVLEIKDGTFGFFTMEYVPGGSLERFWQSYRDKLMPVELAVDIIKQVCAGLGVAHAENPPVVHRDIKPQNILVGYDAAGMRVKVSDFGLAKRANPLTLLVSARGTLGFKPPESFKNMDSCAADVWAIGTTLYLLLTDRLPFPNLDDRDIQDARRFLRPIRPASVYNIQVDSALDAIISRCLAAESADRYPDANALLEDFCKWRPRKSAGIPAMDETTGKTTKSALGMRTPVDSAAAAALVKKAVKYSKEPGKLITAADMLEEAITKDPCLRDNYESQLKLWRRGIVM